MRVANRNDVDHRIPILHLSLIRRQDLNAATVSTPERFVVIDKGQRLDACRLQSDSSALAEAARAEQDDRASLRYAVEGGMLAFDSSGRPICEQGR
jgi:hypothetical protein